MSIAIVHMVADSITKEINTRKPQFENCIGTLGWIQSWVKRRNRIIGDTEKEAYKIEK